MNVVNVHTDNADYLLSDQQDSSELRGSIVDAVRNGGDFVRLDLANGAEAFLLCSPGAAITVVSRAEDEQAPTEAADSRRADLFDPVFDFGL